MVLPGLDGAFCGIAEMDMGEGELKSNVVFGEGFFHFGGAFVVKHVKLWGGSIGLKFLVEHCPGRGDFTGLAGF